LRRGAVASRCKRHADGKKTDLVADTQLFVLVVMRAGLVFVEAGVRWAVCAWGGPGTVGDGRGFAEAGGDDRRKVVGHDVLSGIAGRDWNGRVD
jgi:hypothetical protein